MLHRLRVSGAVTTFAAAVALTLLPAEEARAETLRLAHLYQPDSPSGLGFQRFAELAEEYTDGDVDVRVFPAGQMGNIRDIFTSLRSGAVDLAVVTFPVVADFVPEYAVTTAGYTFRDKEHLAAVLEHPDLGGKWKEQLVERAGVRLLGQHYYGSRVVTVNDKPFHTPEEASGVKIRAVGNPMSLAVVRGLGANPTPMPFAEVYIALTQGVIDGQENPFPTIWAMKFHEVQDYVIETNHQITFVGIGVSERKWQSLSDANREAISRAAKEAMAYATEETVADEERIRPMLAEGGMQFVTPDELDLEAFRQSVQEQVAADFEGKIWPEGLLERIGEVE